MPFNRKGLAHLGGGLWFYRSTDNAAAVTVPGYFAQVPMDVGNWVLRVTFDANGDVLDTGRHVVTAVTDFDATVSTL
jgi:hypothetical protein